MSTVSRIAAVAHLRLREGLRGPLLVLLVLFLVAASAAALLTPGEAGIDRQKAVDGYVMGVARLVLVLAAAVLAAASLATDRDTGREDLLRTTPLRKAELLTGGLLGHAAGLAVLLLGIFLGTLTVTGLLGGGARDRQPTRVLLPDRGLSAGTGERIAPGSWLFLTPRFPEAVYDFPVDRDELPFDEDGVEVRAWIQLRVRLGVDTISLPDTYPIGVKVGSGPERILQVPRQSPLTFTLTPNDLPPQGGAPIRIRRIHPAFTLGVRPAGLAVQGRTRSFPLNLAKALCGWFLALLPLLAISAALSVLVGAPVAVTGTLLFGLLGLSHQLIAEAAFYAEQDMLPISGMGRHLLRGLEVLTPDLTAFDFTTQMVERWDIGLAMLLDRLPASLGGTTALLLTAWLLLLLRRRI